MGDERTAQITRALQEGIEVAGGLGHTLGPWQYAGVSAVAFCERCGAQASVPLLSQSIGLHRDSVAFFGPCLPRPKQEESIWSVYKGGY